MRIASTLIAFLAGFGFTAVMAQSPTGPQSRRLTIKNSAVVNASQLPRHFRADLQQVPMPPPGGEAYYNWLNEQKETQTLPPSVQPQAKTTVAADQPIIGRNFNGNTMYSGIPNDNDMAISNGGQIVSVINSNIFVFDESGTNLMNISLADFSDTLGLTADKFDPKVIYDPAEDRWVITFLSGFTSATSDIVVAFSQTPDATGLWNLYALDGDPINYGDSFTDYPIIALTEQEFFVTINMVRENVSWQTGFVESLIWQCDKRDGYAGDSLDTQLWSNIEFGGKKVRNLCPVRGGSALTGPNLYLLSNRNFATANDSIFFIELSDTIGAPGANVSVNVLLSTEQYGFPPNARQPAGKYFATNDARILGAFIENDQIQFVGNSKDQVLQTPSVYHGIIDNVSSSPTASGHVISDSAMHYGYPNISLASAGGGANESMISFNHTSVDTFAGCSVVYYDGVGAYSDRLAVKRGLNYVDIPWYPGVERWGDYSGSQRRYNSPGVVWMGASYGTLSKEHGTWIAELTSFAVDRPAPATTFEVKAFPNPVVEMVTLTFDQVAYARTDISLVDASGRLIKTFISDHLKPGPQRFTFSTESLGAGIYFLRVATAGNEVASEKIVVSR